METRLQDRPRRRQSSASSKDSTEEELERLIFGDSAGFRENLRAFKDVSDTKPSKELVIRDDSEDDEEDGERTGLEGLADKDLFFLDDGPGEAVRPPALHDHDSDASAISDGAAWSDSDDERITVSLATRPQLRKLRRTEADDLVSGREYSRRLRKQFQVLNPVPEWVKTANGHARKKRRTSSGSEVTDSSADEMDLDNDNDNDNEEGKLSAQPLARLLQNVSALTSPSSTTSKDKGLRKHYRQFKPQSLDIAKMKDITPHSPSPITTLQIHPSLPLLLSTAGPAKTLSLHHLRPQPPDPNPLLTTLHLKHTPLHTALFHPSASGSKVYLGGRRRYMHVWDLATGGVEKVTRVYGHSGEQKSFERFRISPSGEYIALLGSARKGGGVINILAADSMQWVAQVRIDSLGGVADFAWWRDSRGLAVVGKNGEVTEWDLEGRIAVARWRDEGAVGTTTLALGGEMSGKGGLGGDRWIAIGSSSGIVNIYDRRSWGASPSTSSKSDVPNNNGVPTNPEPLRTLDQLLTPISHLAFSPCGQLLCMASRWKTDALRLVHLPSCNVYANWPTGRTPLGRVSAVAFGEDGEGGLCLVVGNEKGAVRGWEIRG